MDTLLIAKEEDLKGFIVRNLNRLQWKVARYKIGNNHPGGKLDAEFKGFLFRTYNNTVWVYKGGFQAFKFEYPVGEYGNLHKIANEIAYQNDLQILIKEFSELEVNAEADQKEELAEVS